MATSVRKPDAVLVTAEIKVDGSTISDEIQIHAIEVETAVNRIPVATVTVADGSAVEETFPVSETATFAPGGEIEILAGYEAKNTRIFKGVIVRHGIRVGPEGESHLVLTCRDKAVKAAIARTSAEFHDVTDGAAIETVLRGLGLGAEVDSGGVTHEHLVLNSATPWDFVLSRAEATGKVVLVSDGTVSVKAPAFDTPDLVAGFGDSIVDLDLEIDAASQLASVTARAWDPATQEASDGASSEPSVNRQGDLSGGKLAGVLDVADVTLTSQSWLAAETLKAWANAALLRSRMSRIRGHVTVPGNAGLRAGRALDLEGLGKRFNGAGYVSGLRHRLKAGDWQTEVTLGLPAEAFTDTRRDVSTAPASGLSPGVGGLQVAVVKQIYGDPKGERRVLVTQPLSKENAQGLWARIATPYASKQAGIEFLPEVGDEVLLGFLDEDPSQPVVLGALHSSARPSPVTPDEENRIKAIVTRSALKLSFDDVDKIVILETPGGHSVTLSDEDKTVTVTNSNGNSLKMSESGIDLSSPKDISVSAEGSVSIKGETGVTMSSPADVGIDGSNVTVKADIALTAQGGASAELTASGEVTVEGAMVMIN